MILETDHSLSNGIFTDKGSEEYISKFQACGWQVFMPFSDWEVAVHHEVNDVK